MPTATASPTPETIRTVEEPPEDAKPVKWRQKSGDVEYAWDGSDLLITSPQLTGFGLFREVWREDVAAMRREDKKTAATVASYIRPVAVVGDFVSFDYEMGYLSGASAWEEQTYETRSVRKPRESIALTDLFPEQTIFQALKANDIVDAAVRRGLANREIEAAPETLRDLSAFLTKVGKIDRFDSDFILREDYLSGFAFDHVDADRVVVRLTLKPYSHAGQAVHGYLELRLSIPPKLSESLQKAASRQAGFLMPESGVTVGLQYASFGSPSRSG